MKIDLKKIIEDAGGYSKVARKLGITKQVVWSWVHVLDGMPPEWVNKFSLKFEVPRNELRPDFYPKSREKPLKKSKPKEATS